MTRHLDGISSASISLKECGLSGIYVSGSDLLEFLKATRPAILTLTDVHLISGTYTSILTYLTSPDSPITCYHLDDIYEGNHLVYFNVPGRSKFRYLRDNPGPSSLTRQTSHVKEEITYRFANGRPLGSGERMRWLKSKAEEYGPPWGGDGFRYDFIELNSQKVRVTSK